MRIFIYKILNTVNNKIYIGQSISPHKRLKAHYADAIHPTKKKFLLQKAMVKYGFDVFSLEIIEECNNSTNADDREIYWIDKYDSRNTKNGYNIAAGGYGGRGLKHSIEWKEMMSKIQIGRKLSIESKKKISEANNGENNGMYEKSHTSLTREKMSSSQNKSRSIRGPLSEDHRKKIKESIANSNKNRLKNGSISLELKTKIFEMYKSCKYTKNKIAELVGLKPNTVIKIIRTLKSKDI